MSTQAPHHEHELKDPSGAWKYTNRLSRESSPYLLQHAHNPVDWYAWGPEAFDEARRSGKPIFLSIGYSTCYWCHVMERQCFENPQIAQLMNAHFVNIKVDREERPDVDDIYMSAVQQLTGRGGWPMSVFLIPPGARGQDDPGLLPFYAGTYFPPAPTGGMPGFPQVVEHLSTAWQQQREQVIEQADNIAQAVTDNLMRRDAGGELSRQLVATASDQLMRLYDQEHGGFSQAPKFPQPNYLDFLIGVYQAQGDDALWRAISHTLDRMARGGMYDQIGGGFHRYSVDDQWLVPHFEKMLYDNGQLVETYCAAHELNLPSADPQRYARVVRQVCDYVLREMLDETGTFWSAQDAEVDTREGGNYIWTAQQVRDALKPLGDASLTEWALVMYGLDRGTNFQDPHHPQEPPANVLYLPAALHELAQRRGTNLDALLAIKEKIDTRLFAVRQLRKQAATDDKVLVSWNGMMIAALARAGRILHEPRYVDAAGRAAAYILRHMRDDAGGLYRTMRQGEAKIPAFLEDYAFLAHGLIELHRSQPAEQWQAAAIQIMERAAERFAAQGGGYYDTLADQPDLFVRTRTFYDGAISSGNSQMMHNLLDLHEITGEHHFLDDAIGDLRSFAGAMQRYGAAMSHMHHALLRATVLAGARVAATSRPHERGEQPVTVSVTPLEVDFNQGSETLQIILEVKDGYHINSNTPTSQYLVPTEILLRDGEGFELTVAYPEGKWKEFTYADEPLSVYEDTVELEATIRALGEVNRKMRPKLVVQYQACTEEACLKVQRVEVELVIK